MLREMEEIGSFKEIEDGQAITYRTEWNKRDNIKPSIYFIGTRLVVKTG